MKRSKPTHVGQENSVIAPSKRPSVPVQRSVLGKATTRLPAPAPPVTALEGSSSSSSSSSAAAAAASSSAAASAAFSSSITLPQLPPIGEGQSMVAVVAAVFDRAGEQREEFRDNYAAVLERKVPKKTYAQDYKAHDQAMRSLVDEGKAALADAVARKMEALSVIRGLEEALAPKLVAAAQCERLSAEVAQLSADLSQAQANEAAADAEVEHLHGLLVTAGEVAAGHTGEIAGLRVRVDEEESLARGLQDDLEEAKERLIEAEGKRKAHAIAEAAELAKVRAEAESAAAGAAAAAATAKGEGERLARELAVCEARLNECRAGLSGASGEVERLTGELGAARGALEAAGVEVERLRREGAAKDVTWGGIVAGVTKSMEAGVEREREVREALATALGERDAAREGESGARHALTRAEGEVERCRGEVERVRGELEAASGALSTARGEVAALSGEVGELRGELRRERVKGGEDAQRVSVLSGKLVEAEEKGRVLGEAEAVWRARCQEWKGREADLLAGRERSEASLAGLTQELRSWKESCLSTMSGGNADTLAALAEARRELALLQVRSKGWEVAAGEAGKLREALFEGEMVRRKLHDTVQELRGCIRVMVRVRPGGTDEASIEIQPAMAASGSVKGGAPGAASGKPGKPLKFPFDHVFPPSAGQQAVFAEVSNLVQSALDGYNVCIFSYGQTGSGKTFTMVGQGEGEGAGLIPRSTHQIRANVARLESQGWEFTVEVSCLEIYNETLKDLLVVDRSTGGGGSAAGAAAGAAAAGASACASAPPPLTVHGAPDTGAVEVPGLTRVLIPSSAPPSTVSDILARAAARRVTAATACNAQSSRSHTVFTVHLKGEHKGRGVVAAGSLALVDLAGSERIGQSGAVGVRQVEAGHINKSLSCLGGVFTALAGGASHIPYRNSKLTHLLAPALRKGGKTLMLVAVSPEEKCAGETLCSLKFAQCVGEVRLGGGGKKPNITASAAAPATAASATAAAAAAAAAATAPAPIPTPITSTTTIVSAPAPPHSTSSGSGSGSSSSLEASGVMLASLLDVSYMSKPGGEEGGGEEEEEEGEGEGEIDGREEGEVLGGGGGGALGGTSTNSAFFDCMEDDGGEAGGAPLLLSSTTTTTTTGLAAEDLACGGGGEEGGVELSATSSTLGRTASTAGNGGGGGGGGAGMAATARTGAGAASAAGGGFKARGAQSAVAPPRVPLSGGGGGGGSGRAGSGSASSSSSAAAPSSHLTSSAINLGSGGAGQKRGHATMMASGKVGSSSSSSSGKGAALPPPPALQTKKQKL